MKKRQLYSFLKTLSIPKAAAIVNYSGCLPDPVGTASGSQVG